MSDPSFYQTNKLLKHLDRLAEWQTTGEVRPILLSIDLTNVCNHRCPDCNGAVGLMGNDRSTMDFDDIQRIAEQAARLGVRAVGFGGGGDASCHPHLVSILRLFRSHGIEIGLISNAQLLRDLVAEAVVDCCTYVRISLDADGPEMYSATHGVVPETWNSLLENTRQMVQLRQSRKSQVTIGTSFLIGTHTIKGIFGAAKVARELGVDYIRMRPYFTWKGDLPFSQHETDEVLTELKRAEELETPTFKVTAPLDRTNWVSSGKAPPPFKKCHIHHFNPQVAANLKMYLCCHTKEMAKYEIGDLRIHSLEEIWYSEKRRAVFRNIDFQDCAQPCALMAHNSLLNMLETSVMHKNFL